MPFCNNDTSITVLRRRGGVQILKLYISEVQIITHRMKAVPFDSADGKEYFTLGASREGEIYGFLYKLSLKYRFVFDGTN